MANIKISVVGIARSGNHPIINWLVESFGLEYLHINNVAYPQDYLHANGSLKDRYEQIFRKFIIEEAPLVIVSYEDKNIEDFQTFSPFPSDEKPDFTVLILRDPYNLIASRKKHNLFNRKDLKIINSVKYSKIGNLWKLYAKEFLRETKYIENVICINYNLWVDSSEYRKEIASKFSFESCEKCLQKVASFGGGSSFDGIKLKDSASEMKVLERWKYFENDPEYLSHFKDKELVELSKKIFGEIPGTEKINN